MKRHLFLLTCLLAALSVRGQRYLHGEIVDRQGDPLVGANVYLEGTYDGAYSDGDGHFAFSTHESSGTLLVSYLGYQTQREQIRFSLDTLEVEITLRPKPQALKEVVIAAGAFEASDEKKSVVLRPLDIVTTAGATGDLAGAINTLPGTQVVGESGQLFVRGGAAYETQTFIDGLRVLQPFSSQAPYLPARHRFSPFLFKGTTFSSGGYSAAYGQALSSALILQSEDLADETQSSLSMSSVFLGGGHTKRWDHTSFSLSVDGSHLGPYYALIPQRQTWLQAPNGLQVNMNLRHQPRAGVRWKLFHQSSRNGFALMVPNPGTDPSRFSLVNTYSMTQGQHQRVLGERTLMEVGLAYGYFRDQIELAIGDVDRPQHQAQGQIALQHDLHNRIHLRTGVKFLYTQWQERFQDAASLDVFNSDLPDMLSVAYAEADLRITQGLVARMGGRVEHSSLLDQPNAAPRLALAQQIGTSGQVSFAYGHFYQTPAYEHLRFRQDLRFEQAEHVLLTYQWMKANRTFRVEAYQKQYRNLLRWNPEQLYETAGYSSDGHGVARGVDVFWRDQSTWDNTDYWISYGWLDTRRLAGDFPELARPGFASTHNLTLVGKRFVPAWDTQIGVTYRFASPRRYTDPNQPGFLNVETPSYHDLSVNVSYLTEIGGHFTIVYLSITNVLGLDQQFGYRYADEPNEQGVYQGVPLATAAPRFLFLGLFMSLKKA